MSLFKKKTGAEPDIRTESGSGRSKVAQLVLLLLIAAFGYLYFFTSLIVPHEGAKPEQSAAPASTPQVKQSMPPRPADTAAAPAPTAAPGVPAAPAAPVPAAAPAQATPPAVGQKPAVAPPAPAAPPQSAAPVKAPATPAAKKAEVTPSKPAEQKQSAAAVKKEEAKPAKGQEKSAVAKDKQPSPAASQAVKKEQKPAPAGEKAKAPAGAVSAGTGKAKAAGGSYTVLVGEFAASDAVAVEAKLNKHKIRPVRSATQKNRQMTRLYYGVYSDYDSYSAALEKLKQSASGSFAIEKDGRYSVYAGSFGSGSHAAAEKKRLAGKGIKVELQQVSLPQSTVRLSAGPFSGRAAADKVASQLKKEGLSVKVIPKGK